MAEGEGAGRACDRGFRDGVTGRLTQEQAGVLVAVGDEAQRKADEREWSALEAREKQKAERRAREAKEKAEAERKAREEAERAAREKAERERKERAAREKAEAERKAREDAERRRALLKPGRTFRDCPECPEMVVVPAGSFMMGSPHDEEGRDKDEGPRHRVTIPKPFAVGKYEVTRREFEAFVFATGRDMTGGCFYWNVKEKKLKRDGARTWATPGLEQTELDPVVCVSWLDATTYVNWLSVKTGKQYRLLSEAEWEYAARSGTTTPFHVGGSITTSEANYNGNFTYGVGTKGVFRRKTTPVGSFKANGFGLHDMLGNVYEWVADCRNSNYRGAPGDGSAWRDGDCSWRIRRGGSWVNRPPYLRSANRAGGIKSHRNIYTGFRVAQTLDP